MSKQADIIFQDNSFLLTGELDFSNVMFIYQKSLNHLHHCPELIFDFAQLKDSNSSGLALIIEWIKFAKQYNKPIRFKALSKNLLSIAQVSGLNKVVGSAFVAK